MNKGYAAAAFILCARIAFAQGADLQVKSVPDWHNGTLTLQIIVPLDLDRFRFPEARRLAEHRAEEERGDLFLEAFSSLTLRSSRTVGEFLAEPDPGPLVSRVVASLPALSAAGVRTMSTVSEDFKSINVAYEYSFFGANGLIAPFVAGERAMPLPAVPGYYATRPFTGLVIDARGKRPSFGKNVEAPCRPALFPRLFYLSSRQTIEPVLDMTMVDPQALKRWGMVGYVRSADPDAYAARAGVDPLTTAAFAVYGTNDTDLVIAEESARRLFASGENRELLRLGKIVVIID